MKTLLLFLPMAACSDHGRTPDPWGVPITGGTMTITSDNHAIVADPDRDRIVSVDLNANAVVAEVALGAGEEPGRVIQDGAGRIHVATRRGGELLTFADANLGDPTRRYVCQEPRGLAYEAGNDRVHVACATGELVSFPAAGGDAVRSLIVDRDLRDVVVQGSNLIISRFRTAELITVDATGAVVGRTVSPNVTRFRFNGGPVGGGPDNGAVDAVPGVAWRAISMNDGSVLISHQRQVKTTLDGEQEGGYGTGCGEGPVEDAISIIKPGQPIRPVHRFGHGALPVDIAVSKAGDKVALVVAGANRVQVVSSAAMEEDDGDDCGMPPPPDDGGGMGGGGGGSGGGGGDDDHGEDRLGTPTSIGFTSGGDLAIFYPELPGIVVRTQAGPLTHTIKFTGGNAGNPGRSVFHQQTRIGLACASCHPEGRDDGKTWSFRTLGQRRTQNLAGDILARAPYHWAGDERNLPTLMDDVFSVRMGGGTLTVAQKESLGPWLDRLAPPSGFVVDAAAAERGRAIFESPETACASCHNGALLTNKSVVDVGKGGAFKVPSLLGVGSRAPYMHDGSAPTLEARFGPAGGGDAHGHTSQLSAAQISDLVAYLNSL